MTVQSLRNSGTSSEQTATIRLAAPLQRNTAFQEKLTAAATRIQAASPNSQLPAITAQLSRLELLACAASFLADSEADDDTSWSSIASSIQPLFRPHCQESDGPERPASPPTPAAEADRPITDIIQEAARRQGIEPALVAAVIKTESNFDHKAISPAGAEGLMQLMPETAKDLGVNNTFDAEQNVHGGTKYLKGLLEKYSGDLDKALAAYNWGPGNVDRQGMDNLPTETRNYLARVKGIYTRLTG
ncbi:MAG: hypothetical protein A2521_11505 [Deltaproteobacteria bacterium RIFOXYD12_FULL_57_12]|nr:MAG: hypothetical protein A2521_11505 [Deltaproteobacteria bacterium RIFOXYD12_FULL_57_12]